MNTKTKLKFDTKFYYHKYPNEDKLKYLFTKACLFNVIKSFQGRSSINIRDLVRLARSDLNSSVWTVGNWDNIYTLVVKRSMSVMTDGTCGLWTGIMPYSSPRRAYFFIRICIEDIFYFGCKIEFWKTAWQLLFTEIRRRINDI